MQTIRFGGFGGVISGEVLVDLMECAAKDTTKMTRVVPFAVSQCKNGPTFVARSPHLWLRIIRQNSHSRSSLLKMAAVLVLCFFQIWPSTDFDKLLNITLDNLGFWP